MRFKGGIYLDGGVAGDGGGDSTAERSEVFPASGEGVGVGGLVNDFRQHAFEFAAFETNGSGFDGEGAGAEGFGFKAVFIKLIGNVGEDGHLVGLKIDEQRHEQALALDGFRIAGGEDLLEEDALVGDVLVDDPESLVIDGEDERVAELAERAQGSQGGEGVLLVLGLNLGGCGGDLIFCLGCGVARVSARRDASSGGKEGGGSLGPGLPGGGSWEVLAERALEGQGAGLGRGLEGGESKIWVGRLGMDGCGVERFCRAGEVRGRLGDERGAGERCSVERREEGGCGAGSDQGGAQAVADEVVDGRLLAEADLSLGRVDVDVDLFGREFKEKQDDGEGCGGDDVAVGLRDCVEHKAVADEAFVDEDVYGVAIELLEFGLGEETGEAEVAWGGWGTVGLLFPGRWGG